MNATRDFALRCVWNVGAELGEGPIWVPRDHSVYFVDIVGRAIHRWGTGGARQSWRTPAEPGFVFPMTRGGLVCGLRGGLYHFEPRTGAFELMAPVEADRALHRLNDGFVDSTGRLWFGTMHQDTQTPGGALYSLDKHGALQVHDQDYVVTNGPAVSPDHSTLYHSDSALRTVYAFDLQAGRLSNKRPFVTLPAGSYPDGMAVDIEGFLWIAVFNGWCVQRYSPQGTKVQEIRLPCAHVTKPAFGDADRKTLYITTARIGLSEAELAEQPLAGALLSIRVPVSGPSTTSFERHESPESTATRSTEL